MIGTDASFWIRFGASYRTRGPALASGADAAQSEPSSAPSRSTSRAFSA